MWSWLSGPRREGGEATNVLPDGRDVRLELFKYDACPFCAVVYGAIDRLGARVAYRDTRRDPGQREALRTLTGRTQVPCLLIDGVPLLESRDIVRWLEEAFSPVEGVGAGRRA